MRRLRRRPGRADARGRARFESVNSCLVPLAAVRRRSVVTVEGVAARDGTLHPVQRAMVEPADRSAATARRASWSACSANTTARRARGFDPEAIGGNLCRCTGYRPIADVARAPAGRRRADDPRLTGSRAAAAPRRRRSSGAALRAPDQRSTSCSRCCAERPSATLIAGGTDLMVDVNQKGERCPALISLEALPELRAFARRRRRRS